MSWLNFQNRIAFFFAKKDGHRAQNRWKNSLIANSGKISCSPSFTVIQSSDRMAAAFFGGRVSFVSIYSVIVRHTNQNYNIVQCDGCEAWNESQYVCDTRRKCVYVWAGYVVIFHQFSRRIFTCVIIRKFRRLLIVKFYWSRRVRLGI